MQAFQVGDWVRWHSKKRKRWMTGQIVDLEGYRALIIVTTWDGRGHHWREPFRKLRRIEHI